MIMIFFPFVRRVRAINFTRFLLILLLFHSYLIIKSFLLYYEVNALGVFISLAQKGCAHK